MLELVQSLRDAPVMNLFVLVGFLLVILAAAGKAPFGRIDVAGRILSAICGVGLLGAATMMFLGIRSAREALPEDRTQPGVGTHVVAPAPLPVPPPPDPATETAPAATQPGVLTKGKPHHGPAVTTFSLPSPTPMPTPASPALREVELPPVEEQASWSCSETRTVTASMKLPPGAEFRSAVVEVAEVDKARAFRRLEPRYEASSRTVTGAVEFTGLDKVFFNCPGGGHAAIRLVVRAAVR